MDDTIQNAINYQAVIDSLKKMASSSSAILESQQIYNTNMSNFLNILGVCIALTTVLVAIVALVNIRQTLEIRRLENKIKSGDAKINKYILDFCFDAAVHHWHKDDILDHFSKLSFYYKLSLESNIYTYKSTNELNHLRNFIRKYEKKHLKEAAGFLIPFKKIIGKDKCKEERYYKKAEQIWDELCEKFGGKDEVEKAMGDFDPGEAYRSLLKPR